MGMLPEYMVYDIPAALFVVLLVQGLKLLGMPVGLAAWGALAMSILITALEWIAVPPQDSAGVVGYVIEVLVVFLTATGVYEKGKDLRSR